MHFHLPCRPLQHGKKAASGSEYMSVLNHVNWKDVRNYVPRHQFANLLIQILEHVPEKNVQ